MRLQGSTFAAVFAAATLVGTAGADPLPVGPDLEGSGWRTHSFAGIAATRFAGLDDGGVRLTADRSSALLYRPLPEGMEDYRSLAWTWRVDRPIPSTDLTVKGADDRPLALHIWFPDPHENAGLLERIGGFLVEEVLDVPLTGMVLTYVWGGTHPPGESLINPHTGTKGMMIVLRDGSTESGRWYQEKIDFAADFERVFGQPAPAPSFIALSADSDDTNSHSDGQIRDLRLLRE